MPFPGQHESHLHPGSLHSGQSVEHSEAVGSLAGGSQNPMAAKHMHAVFSAGQHDGHASPFLYFGFSPALQKSSYVVQTQWAANVRSRVAVCARVYRVVGGMAGAEGGRIGNQYPGLAAALSDRKPK